MTRNDDWRVGRLALLVRLAVDDTWRAVRDHARPRPLQGHEDAIDAGLRWLCLTHDVTGRQGSSRGYSLVRGWALPFPETTGYIIGTLLACARRGNDSALVERAEQMGDWEIEVQCEDGGVMEGLLTKTPKRSTIFNTGMVMHGWLDLHERSPRDDYLEAAARGGEFLRRSQDADGAWRGEVEYFRIPHTYCARVSWALLRLAKATGDDSYRKTATRQLDWVLQVQNPAGWFEWCAFEPGRLPNTHGIAYTLRGLLESHALIGHDGYLEAVIRTSDALIPKLDAHPALLPASYDAAWRPRARHECLTGTAQLGGVWLRLFELTRESRFLVAGMRAVERAAAHQLWDPGSINTYGALPGSYPIYGRYAPLAFPNWATKFLIDSLLLYERNSAARPTALSPS
jgi:hypothetical protein